MSEVKIHFEIGRNMENGTTEQVESSNSLNEIVRLWMVNNYSIPEYFIDIWEAIDGEESYPMGDVNITSLNLIGWESEEYCAECEEIFDTQQIRTECSNCGENVISCNACGNCGIKCKGCSKASNFINHTKEEVKV